MPGLLREQTCKNCGKLFMTRHPEQSCCGRSCAREYANKDKPVYTIVCGGCGKSFKSNYLVDSRGIERKYCCMDCLRAAHAAKKPKHRKCAVCGVEFCAIVFLPRWGRYAYDKQLTTCSTKCRSELKRGHNNPMWQGGITAYHRSRNWQTIAEKARARDKYTCQRCGKKQEENGRKLDVHHIITYHTVNDSKKANKLSNLITLCSTCHRKVESKSKAHRQVVLPFEAFEQEKRHATGNTRAVI